MSSAATSDQSSEDFVQDRDVLDNTIPAIWLLRKTIVPIPPTTTEKSKTLEKAYPRSRRSGWETATISKIRKIQGKMRSLDSIKVNHH
jgi:hypothetical protein